jgi:hypothetical protein
MIRYLHALFAIFYNCLLLIDRCYALTPSNGSLQHRRESVITVCSERYITGGVAGSFQYRKNSSGIYHDLRFKPEPSPNLPDTPCCLWVLAWWARLRVVGSTVADPDNPIAIWRQPDASPNRQPTVVFSPPVSRTHHFGISRECRVCICTAPRRKWTAIRLFCQLLPYPQQGHGFSLND